MKPDGTMEMCASAQPTVAWSYNAVEINLDDKRRQMHFLDRGMHDDSDVAVNERATHLLHQPHTIRLKGGRRVKVYGPAYILRGVAMTPCIRTRAPSDEIATVIGQYLKGRNHVLQAGWDHRQCIHDLFVADSTVSDADMMAIAMALT
jgi:hypothetical protein